LNILILLINLYFSKEWRLHNRGSHRKTHRLYSILLIKHAFISSLVHKHINTIYIPTGIIDIKSTRKEKVVSLRQCAPVWPKHFFMYEYEFLVRDCEGVFK
jgi:hypothetical protein